MHCVPNYLMETLNSQSFPSSYMLQSIVGVMYIMKLRKSSNAREMEEKIFPLFFFNLHYSA